jgi:hypothetical protein
MSRYSGRLKAGTFREKLCKCSCVAQPKPVELQAIWARTPSALWAAYKDASVVRRYGRWASDAFHTYLWEDREYSRGMSESMIKTSLTPT